MGGQTEVLVQCSATSPGSSSPRSCSSARRRAGEADARRTARSPASASPWSSSSSTSSAPRPRRRPRSRRARSPCCRPRPLDHPPHRRHRPVAQDRPGRRARALRQRERHPSGAVLARLTQRPELEEAMFLSTCNRVSRSSPSEAACHPRGVSIQSASHAIRSRSGSTSARPRSRSSATTFTSGAARTRCATCFAWRHRFIDGARRAPDPRAGEGRRTTSAHRGRALRSHLARCVSRSFTVAKRVRTETQLGADP